MPSERVGWRLTVEPVGPGYAWSLLRNPGGDVWAGLVAEAADLRTMVDQIVDPQDPVASPLLDPIRETALAARLGALIPQPLREALSGTGRHTLTVAARGWASRAPWPALGLDDSGTRLIERATIVGGLPTGVISAHRPRSRGNVGLLVVDPGPLVGAEPSLYPAGYPSRWYAATGSDRLVPDGVAYTPGDLAADLNRDDLDRFFYFGHIRQAPAESPAGAALVLSDNDRAMPFAAQAWFGDPERWPAPRSVALIGCGSDDAAHQEQTGLAMAALAGGAHHVVATRWLLPADGITEAGTTDLALTIAHLQRGPELVVELARWQAVQLQAWRATGAPAVSPLLWASLVAYSTPADWQPHD